MGGTTRQKISQDPNNTINRPEPTNICITLYQQKLEIIDEFGKVIVYKINIQKSVIFLNTNNKISEREIKKTIPFTVSSKRIEYTGINLPKEAKDLHSENCKMLMKETEGNTNRWKDHFDITYA